jgi:hypothetical protein
MQNSGSDHSPNGSLRARFLDLALPLAGASHAQVVNYGVHTPMRYTECFAVLEDGRRVPFRDRGQFVAWARDGNEKCFLFRGRYGRLELRVPGSRRTHLSLSRAGTRKFVLRDGARLEVRRWGTTLALPFVAVAGDPADTATLSMALE